MAPPKKVSKGKEFLLESILENTLGEAKERLARDDYAKYRFDRPNNVQIEHARIYRLYSPIYASPRKELRMYYERNRYVPQSFEHDITTDEQEEIIRFCISKGKEISKEGLITVRLKYKNKKYDKTAILILDSRPAVKELTPKIKKAGIDNYFVKIGRYLVNEKISGYVLGGMIKIEDLGLLVPIINSYMFGKFYADLFKKRI